MTPDPMAPGPRGLPTVDVHTSATGIGSAGIGSAGIGSAGIGSAGIGSAAMDSVVEAISQLPPSTDADEVFTAIAHAAVPLVCDTCTVRLIREREDAVHLEHPVRPEPADTSIVISIQPVAAEAGRGYSGSLTLGFRGPDPGDERRLLGQLLVELGVSIIERERLRSKAANLELALISNREIGAAIGILMMTHKCTSDQAFDMLRRASQHTHRKLAALARDVTTTGVLETQPHPEPSTPQPQPTNA